MLLSTRIGPYSLGRIGRLLRGSLLLVVVAAVISAGAYRLFIQFTPFDVDGFRGAFMDWFIWQLVAWSPWLVFGPLTVLYAERLMVRQRSSWRRVLAHIVVCSALMGVCSVWYVNVALLPVIGVEPFFRAIIGDRVGLYLVYTRWMMPALIAVYVGMVMWATRGLLVGLHASPAGLISENGPHGAGESQPRPVIAYDREDFAVLAVNAAAVQRYGRTPDEFLHLRVTDLMTAGSASAFGAAHARSSGWFLWGGKGVHLAADGSEFEVDFLNQQVSLHDRVAELLLVTDLSEQRRAQTALQDSERQTAELELQLANARLRALQLQLKPHFLFNSLNTAAMMIRTGDYDDAQQVVTMLGDIFRRLLEFEGETTITLAREMEFVLLYLGLQQRRFSDRVDVQVDVAPDALESTVPTLVLQPLVENAVQHGVAGMSGKCSIDIKAVVTNGRLVLSISNDVSREHRPQKLGSGHSVGLRNTRERLHESHGDKASLRIDERADRFTITLELPA